VTNEWRQIETAPEDKAVLCFWTGQMILSDDWRYGVAKFDLQTGAWIDPETEDGFLTDPAHWMPLPPPPVRP
jgi:hypothetical protein